MAHPYLSYVTPTCYNGRSTGIIPSSKAVHRPRGVFTTETGVIYEPSRKLDFELELGYFVSKPVPHGETLAIESVAEHIFGFVLLNDWSARDIQAFEMRPLGPFNSKGRLKL